jgi:hypothetical protein
MLWRVWLLRIRLLRRVGLLRRVPLLWRVLLLPGVRVRLAMLRIWLLRRRLGVVPRLRIRCNMLRRVLLRRGLLLLLLLRFIHSGHLPDLHQRLSCAGRLLRRSILAAQAHCYNCNRPTYVITGRAAFGRGSEEVVTSCAAWSRGRPPARQDSTQPASLSADRVQQVSPGLTPALRSSRYVWHACSGQHHSILHLVVHWSSSIFALCFVRNTAGDVSGHIR